MWILISYLVEIELLSLVELGQYLPAKVSAPRLTEEDQLLLSLLWTKY